MRSHDGIGPLDGADRKRDLGTLAPTVFITTVPKLMGHATLGVSGAARSATWGVAHYSTTSSMQTSLQPVPPSQSSSPLTMPSPQ